MLPKTTKLAVMALLIFCLTSLASAQTVLDPSFESKQVGAGKFARLPLGTPWTFAGNAGISANGSGFTIFGPSAPQGNQIAYLQGTSSVSQIIKDWPVGPTFLTVSAIQRQNWPTPGGSHQDLTVSVDGQFAGVVRPSGPTYQTYYVLLPPVAAGDHTLMIAGLNTAGGDNTAFIDQVNIAAAVATPASVADTWIGSSGKTVGFRLVAGNTPISPTQVIALPTIYVNGMATGPLGSPADLAGNEVLLFPLPTGVVIGVGDTVTATTPPIWQATTGGLVAPIDGLTVDNRVGRSPLPPSALVPKTFVPGVNNNTWPSGPWGNYWPFKNWAYKCNWPPGHMDGIKGSGTIRVYSNAGANGVDGTGYPGPAGLWLVYWRSGGAAGGSAVAPATFALTTVDATNTTVMERKDLANPAAPGGYQARVFDFQRSTSSTTANIDVALAFSDPSGKGNYSDLWIVGPGDFDCAANTPVTFDTSDPFALSRTYTQWIPPGVGSLRWVDSSNCGGNPVSCPYPELLMTKTDTGWGELSGRTVRYGYTAMGPVDTQATPWQYSPFYRADSEQFTATLADPIATTPAVGTNETYTFSDADTAPLMAGLEVTIDAEVMRIIRVSGQKVTLYRGSNGTSPAAHQPGSVKVSGRRPIQIPASGIAGDAHTYQLTTATPHGQMTGSMSMNTIGTWPTVAWTAGDPIGRIDARPPLVTGPNTLVQVVSPAVKGGAKPVQTVTLDPAKCYSQVTYSGYIPPEVTAIATGKFRNAALHVNINPDACDDFVWTVMRRVRDNFPPGRTVIVEYLNEPWNFAFGSFEYCTRAAGTLGYENPYTLSYYCRRACEVGAIARAAFRETGRDSEIKLMLNCQLGSDQPKNHLTYAAKNGWQVDRIGNAPYLMIDTGLNAFATWDDDQLCDLWPIYLWYDKRPNCYTGWTAVATKAIADYNKAVGNDGCQLMGYEGGIETAIPAGMPNQLTRGLDLVYNPNWYWMEDVFYRWCQRQGFVNLHVYSLSQYHSPHLWGIYHAPRQKPGYGDGRLGGQDNRLRLARPGQPHSKAPGVNVDLNDSVRGQAFIDWTR